MRDLDSTYRPDSWAAVMLERKNCEKVYKLACSWGGYTASSEWRLSSSIESIKVDGDKLVMKQRSGSTYVVNRGQRTSMLVENVLMSLEANRAEAGLKVTRLAVDELLDAFKEKAE